jgi:UDP-glucose:glycoprotein glucosyltransferase
MAPLKVWQVQELSLQAAERIMSSPKEEALKVLTNIAQNFPLQVSKFTGGNISDQCERDVSSSTYQCSSLVLISVAHWLHEADQLSAPSAKVWGKCMEVSVLC